MNTAQLSIATLIGLMTGGNPAMAQGVGPAPIAAAPPAQVAAPGTRPAPPTRDPNTPGYVTAKDLPDGAVPPPDADETLSSARLTIPHRKWPCRNGCRK